MNPDMRLVIAGALLLVALAFFFFGQSLVNAPDDIPAETPTPSAFLRAVGLLRG
jgi:hypothetical protein